MARALIFLRTETFIPVVTNSENLKAKEFISGRTGASTRVSLKKVSSLVMANGRKTKIQLSAIILKVITPLTKRTEKALSPGKVAINTLACT